MTYRDTRAFHGEAELASGVDRGPGGGTSFSVACGHRFQRVRFLQRTTENNATPVAKVLIRYAITLTVLILEQTVKDEKGTS
ncbi:hypothetical protein NDN08_004317 [Rhodosorus marinus]|uniref:Uncharacterized protein n=1 Tax=Rhodosorus marinus TaxID=101924 RepID=A0AAV8UPV4_9RHOD|nr:hypothetical protein NDN08_004317 [Rhodosorus marinus]